jgi:competence transcription factor ComK
LDFVFRFNVDNITRSCLFTGSESSGFLTKTERLIGFAHFSGVLFQCLISLTILSRKETWGAMMYDLPEEL